MRSWRAGVVGEGLHQKAIGVRLDPIEGFRSRISGEVDDRDHQFRRDSRCGLDAVDFAIEIDVHEHDIRWAGFNPLQCHGSSGSHPVRRVSHSGQRIAQAQSNDALIFDDQDRRCGRPEPRKDIARL